MKTVFISGSDGFIGKNLRAALMKLKDVKILTFDIKDNLLLLTKHLGKADIVYHLAGVNRPDRIEEFENINVGLTQDIVNILQGMGRHPTVVFSSSTQATLNNPYGTSKKKAEDILTQYAKRCEGRIHIYRLPNVFGKWSRPNYNSVVATFCYNISHGLDISISDENKELELVYSDDVVNEFVKFLTFPNCRKDAVYCEIGRKHRITLGELAKKIYQLRDIRSSLVVPDLADDFMKCLHATYLSYLDKGQFSYPLDVKTDHRGCLAELIKSEHFGQIFVSKTHEGVVRGNHYHDSKIEKFCVIQGEGIIKFRHILKGEVLSYPVSGKNIEVVDIPPGYTHSIENVGKEEMIVIFWANQVFDPINPDTYYLEVRSE